MLTNATKRIVKMNLLLLFHCLVCSIYFAEKLTNKEYSYLCNQCQGTLRFIYIILQILYMSQVHQASSSLKVFNKFTICFSTPPSGGFYFYFQLFSIFHQRLGWLLRVQVVVWCCALFNPYLGEGIFKWVSSPVLRCTVYTFLYLYSSSWLKF